MMKRWMPAEWSCHTRCWMLWPFHRGTWRAGAVPAQKAFLDVAYAISKFEPVWMGVPRAQSAQATQSLKDYLHLHTKDNQVGAPQHGIHLVPLECDDAWMRDVGPTFVFSESGQLIGTDWIFNGWGEKPPVWDTDDTVARSVCEEIKVERIRADFILEGGSIHVDGEGTLITTEQCLLNKNRNPNLSKEQIELRLKEYLGVQTVIWLPRGLVGDHDTDGHIDNMCCFTRPGEVLLAWSDDPTDEQYEICREASKVLEGAVDARKRNIKVLRMPVPPPLYSTEEETKELRGGIEREKGERLAASYVNFYIANGGVVFPTFGVETDLTALQILQRIFPQRTVVPVPGREILLGGGNIHCITQQQPALSLDTPKI
eukprot:TRINITY_DN7108_c0_g1_i1.p1 TRINITY_DN7108_c0_g1~~TRINITY_DN7108_c0_g1_i1.p1  ORF type:complete len:372 (-),score=51.57 TRINITY_DN7108_c0_g1_i1:141-1256(-)